MTGASEEGYSVIETMIIQMKIGKTVETIKSKILEDTDGDGKADKGYPFLPKGLNIRHQASRNEWWYAHFMAPDFNFPQDTDGDECRKIVREVHAWLAGAKVIRHAGPSNLKYGFDNKIGES